MWALFVVGAAQVLNPLDPPEEVFILQTYLVDQIGQFENRYQAGTLGKTSPSIMTTIEENLMTTRTPIYVNSPFWHHFLDHRYHYFPLPKLLPNFSQYFTFDPPSIDVLRVGLFTTKVVNVFVKNMLRDQIITIAEILTTSRLIYVLDIDILNLPPEATTVLTLMITPTKTGYISETIFVRTSVGIIPYTVNILSVGNERDAGVPTLYHFPPGHPINLTLRVPDSIKGSECTFVYDRQLFDSDNNAFNGKYVTLGAGGLIPCSVVTFCHFVGPGVSKTIPVCILVSGNSIQPYHPVILLDVVTTKHGYAEADIRIVNPTSSDFYVFGATLPGNQPINIRTEPYSSPVKCGKSSYTVVGKIVVTGVKEGAVDTTLSITWGENEKHKSATTINVPVKAAVIYGALIPDKEAIVITSHSSCSITIKNTFKRPVMFYSAKTDSSDFEIENFKPAIVGPGEVSEPISVHFTLAENKESFETKLTIYTNITTLQIPVIGFNGRVSIGEGTSNSTSSTLIKNIGKALVGSTVNLTVTIYNSNPIPFTTRTVETSPGIDINYEWMAENNETLKNFSIPPFSNRSVNVFVNFMNVHQRKMRNDTITMSDGGKSVSVVMSWIPVHGSMEINTDLPREMSLGSAYVSQVSLLSTYGVILHIKDIKSNSTVHFTNPNGTVVKKGAEQQVSNVSLTLTQEFLRNSRYGSLFNLTSSWKKLRYAWTELWDEQITFPVAVVIKLKANTYIRKILRFKISCEHIKDTYQNLDRVVIGGSIRTNFTLTNPYDVPARFEIQSNMSSSDVVVSERSLVIEPKESRHIEFLVKGISLGENTYRVPVVSNITPPFFFGLLYSCTLPELKIVHNNTYVDNVTVNSEWTNVTLINVGDLPLHVYSFTVLPERELVSGFAITTNCGTDIYSNSSCHVQLGASIYRYTRPLFFTRNYYLCLQFGTYSKKIPLIVNFTKKETSEFKAQIRHHSMLMCMICMFVPLCKLYMFVTQFADALDELDRRVPQLRKKLVFEDAMKNHCSVETQYVAEQEEKKTGGTFVSRVIDDQSYPSVVTSESCSEMENMLASICLL